MISTQSHIGQKGYTIPKTALTSQQLRDLKQDLYKIPMVNGKKMDTDSGFPIYRENQNKIYVPRFYGIAKYGMPSRIDIPTGDVIDVPFNSDKPLFSHQINAIDTYLKHIEPSYTCAGAILELACGMGKTVLALHLLSQLKRKTIILVHKEFLMDQWIKRIEEFLPTARVGKLQGPKCEIEGNDIVLGMIQSIYSRDFPPNTFDSFGFTIIDEVHRIGSSEFSNTLSKVVTPLILGISATVDRKDSLTDVLYSFIGPKILSAGRQETTSVVTVRQHIFKSIDTSFQEVEYDFRGQVKYSTMMTKLCQYSPRSDYIVNIIRQTIQERPTAQMIVLAHYRSLLVYLYKALTTTSNSSHKPTVGYYVGGMKQKALDSSESCQIVLATYAMAAEALDIKNLSILVLCTPKTDVVQSVGRILRTHHDNPLIIDIVDPHTVFQNQWKKRKQFYRKNKYTLLQFKSQQQQQQQQQHQSDDEEDIQSDDDMSCSLEGMEL